MRWSSSIIAVSICACSEPQSLWLSSGGASSAIIAVDRDGQLELSAFELSADRKMSFDLDASVTQTVYALRYTRTLESMRLSAGHIEIVERGLPLPRPDQPLLTTNIHGGVSSSWSELSTLPGRLELLQIKPATRCVRFKNQILPIEDTLGDPAMFTLALDRSTVLIGLSTGRLYRVTPQAIDRLPDLTTTPRDTAVLDPASGDLWLASAGGRVARGTLERGFDDLDPIPTASTASVVLSGGTGSGGFELYAATSAFELWRRAGNTWTLLRSDPGSDEERSRLQVSWIAPGFVLATGWGNHKLIVYENNQTTLELLPLPFQIGQDDALYGIGRVEGFGGMVGSRYSVLFARDEQKLWRMFPLPVPTDANVAVLASLDGGIFFGGQDGVLTQFHEGIGYCDPQNYGSYDLSGLAPLEDGFIAVERATAERGTRVVRIERE